MTRSTSAEVILDKRTFQTSISFPMRQIAYARLILPDGKVLHRQVVIFDCDGIPQSWHPLTEEEPFTEWKNEELRIKP